MGCKTGRELAEYHQQCLREEAMEEIDLKAAEDRVNDILHQPAPETLHAPHGHPEAPKQRKQRSDAGKPKGPKHEGAILLPVTIDEARQLALVIGAAGNVNLATAIQDEIIAHLQKRIDALSRAK